MQRMIVTVISLAALVSGCGSDSGTQAAPSSSAPSATPSIPTTSDGTAQPSLLEGTWRTGTVTERDTKATLRKYGLGKYIKPFQALAPDPSADIVFTLEIREGRWDLYGETGGGAAEPLDYDARYEVDGKKVVVSHEGESNTYGWSVSGDTLRLTWLGTTYKSVGGIPEEVLQRALYMTSEFERQE